MNSIFGLMFPAALGTHKENPNPNANPNSHDQCLLSKWKCRTCAHVQLDKSRVEKEFTSSTFYPSCD